MKKILDIGCGKDKYKSPDPSDEVIGLDVVKLSGVDVVWDLHKIPLPFKDEEFDMVVSVHSIEHIKNVMQVIEEIYRILKPGGIAKISVPHFCNPGAYHFTHKTYWSYYSFDCFEEKTKESYYSKARFKILKKEIKLIGPFGFLERFVNRFPILYEWRLRYFFPAYEIRFTLKKTAKK